MFNSVNYDLINTAFVSQLHSSPKFDREYEFVKHPIYLAASVKVIGVRCKILQVKISQYNLTRKVLAFRLVGQ